MNIIDAIKSGKEFKRPEHTLWLNSGLAGTVYVHRTDAIADDWEVKEEKFIITEEILKKAISSVYPYSYSASGVHYLIEELKKLSLEESKLLASKFDRFEKLVKNNEFSE